VIVIGNPTGLIVRGSGESDIDYGLVVRRFAHILSGSEVLVPNYVKRFKSHTRSSADLPVCRTSLKVQ